ncbi:MAG: hypothetical protein V4454_12730 [Pseudomonadota bacterium]
MANIFIQLTKLRNFEKRHLPYLRSIEDFDIVRSVGAGQELGQPFLLKHLYVEGIGSVATVTRRLNRLRAQGTLIASSHNGDKRNIALSLAPTVLKTYMRYGILLTSIGELVKGSSAKDAFHDGTESVLPEADF